MAEGLVAQEIKPGETYQIDSSEYDSDEDRNELDEDEYDRLVEEAESGFTDEEVLALTAELKEKGIVNFLREYLAGASLGGRGDAGKAGGGVGGVGGVSGADGSYASLRKLLLGFGVVPPKPLRNPLTPNLALLPFTKLALLRILRRREKLTDYNTLEDALALLKSAKNIIILSGAGISTSCGIPDFRSADGLYANLQREGKWELDDPQQMFDIRYFVEHPEVFYSFAKQIYPSNFVPSPCHRWIKMLENRGVLLRNYTQNIDTLESLAGVEKVLQCHGSFKTASCLRCKERVPGPTIEPYIMSSQIPYCGSCRQKRDAEIETRKGMKAAQKKERDKVKGKGKGKGVQWGSEEDEESEDDEWGGGLPGIMKPDITFFGQALDSEFDDCLYKDREKVDLLVIIGTSLKVAPVSEVLTHIPHSVPQIFINLTPVNHVRPDISLLGDADSIVTYLSAQLGWHIPPPAAVAHSPNAKSKPLAQDDTIGNANANGHGMPNGKTSGALKVPPEKAKWTSFVGEMSHVHVMSHIDDPDSPTVAPPLARTRPEDPEESDGSDGSDRSDSDKGSDGSSPGSEGGNTGVNGERGEKIEVAGRTRGNGGGGEDEEDEADGEDGEDGYESDDERPSKRHRADGF